MITADRAMTLFNIRIDNKARREILVPTGIQGVSFYEIDSSKYAGGIRSEEIDCKIRIPVNAFIESGRKYIPESQYKGLEDEEALSYWTLQKGAYILMASVQEPYCMGTDPGTGNVITKESLLSLCADPCYTGPLISIVEYADNTQRGNNAVKHWRIGGK